MLGLLYPISSYVFYIVWTPIPICVLSEPLLHNFLGPSIIISSAWCLVKPYFKIVILSKVSTTFVLCLIISVGIRSPSDILSIDFSLTLWAMCILQRVFHLRSASPLHMLERREQIWLSMLILIPYLRSTFVHATIMSSLRTIFVIKRVSLMLIRSPTFSHSLWNFSNNILASPFDGLSRQHSQRISYG